MTTPIHSEYLKLFHSLKYAVILFFFVAISGNVSILLATGRNNDALIPIHSLFLNTKTTWAYKVSPDGNYIAWIGTKGTKSTIFFRKITATEFKTVRNPFKTGITDYQWSKDSKHFIFSKDNGGKRDFHVYKVDINKPVLNPVNLTPSSGVTFLIHSLLDNENMLVYVNGRNGKDMDLYLLNIETGALKLIYENPGNVDDVSVDDSCRIRAIICLDSIEGNGALKLIDKQGNVKKTFAWENDYGIMHRMPIMLISHITSNNYLYVSSQHNRDTRALVQIDLETDEEKVLFENPSFDIEDVFLDQSGKPFSVVIHPDYPGICFIDETIKNEWLSVVPSGPFGIQWLSVDKNGKFATIRLYTDTSSQFILWDKETRKIQVLSTDPIDKFSHLLSKVHPIEFNARDGMLIHGYLTIPRFPSSPQMPLIAYVHGGPPFRDHWEYDNEVQFFASRGYAVLQVNFRGSAFYGKKFMEAGKHEFAGLMRTDMMDGISYVIKKGIIDTQKIAIGGCSFGGYAALMWAAKEPGYFRCAVDECGPTDWKAVLDKFVIYGKHELPYWYAYAGDPSTTDGLALLRNSSPLYFTDSITCPTLLYYGKNDPLVNYEYQFEPLLKKLKTTNKNTKHILARNEGHGRILNWKNVLRYRRLEEKFLAEWLGGRNAGFDLFELGYLFFWL